ncbi:MAG: methyltransferase domain-containing protein [Actinomycetota bacterium]|nr:methyltransferase domain-containing protein [Actinomycetota bacterium]
MTHTSRFDEIAPVYDETRGGEERGDEYATDIDRLLPQDHGTVLEIGVGTGVVSLGLRKRGRTVVGVDLSGPMLARAAARLGSSVARGDAQCLPVRTAGVRHAVAVWVIHDVADPERLLGEAARVIEPGGNLVVSDMQIPHRGDPIGRILGELTDRLHAHHPSGHPNGLRGEEIIDRAAAHRFTGELVRIERAWPSHPSYELNSIRTRAWSALRRLDDHEYNRIAGPAIAALEALPQEETIQRAWSELAVMTRESG